MATQRPNYGFFLLAALFLISTFGVSGLVVYEALRDKKTAEVTSVPTVTAVKSNSTSLTDGPSPVQTTSSPTPTTTNGGTVLQGTKLANFTPVAGATQIQSTDLVVGEGAEVKPGATVTAHYTGAVSETGIIFQSSYDRAGQQPIEFSLNGVIQGWTDGVPGMRVGGTRRLVIPAALAYGAKPPQGSGIPANADLVFDIVITATK
jgi:FKBP-type peptidyl-prolyl cis-trans isomerase